MKRIALWLVVRMMKKIAQNQGFCKIDIGVETYRVYAVRERDGLIHEYMTYDLGDFISHMVRLYKFDRGKR